MWNPRWVMVAMVSILVSACVTINVYFPEAQAEKAAEQFIDNVIGPAVDEAKGDGKEESGQRPPSLGQLFAIIPTANAQQADISIETPAIKAIQSRMSARFQSQLSAYFDSGALGLTRDGLVELRDGTAVPLAERAAVKQAVADDNRDRDAVYREIAVANGHPEWEGDIRATFARQWVQSARAGWWFQDAAGSWKKK